MANNQHAKGQARTGLSQKLKRPRETPNLTGKDGTAAISPTTIKEEITCTICLDSFKDPVITQCGHTFCRACISEYWKESCFGANCPLCRDFCTKQILIPNRQLRNITENYKEPAVPSRSPQTKKQCIRRKNDLNIFSENETNLLSTERLRSNAHQGHTDFSEDTSQQSKLLNDLKMSTSGMGRTLAKIERRISDVTRSLSDVKERFNLMNVENFPDSPRTTSLFSKGKYPDLRTSRRWTAIIKMPGWIEENVLLDRETAHPRYIVVPDLKRVEWRGYREIVTYSPQRFEKLRCVLGMKGFTSGKHYWTVNILCGNYWAVGVAKKSVDRKNEIDIKPENGIWAFGYSSQEYKVLTSPPTLLELDSQPFCIRVYLDYDAGIVGFSNDDDSCIYMFESADFGKEKVFPFFRIGNETSSLQLSS